VGHAERMKNNRDPKRMLCMADQEEERRTEGLRFRWLDDVEDLREREKSQETED
jgi:hypothetical protein